MTAVASPLESLIKNRVRPWLRLHGYEPSSPSGFTRTTDDAKVHIDLQRSRRSTSELTLVTVNLTVRVQSVTDRLARNEGPTLEWHWRRRVEVVEGGRASEWWGVDDEKTANVFFDDVQRALDPTGFLLLEKLSTVPGLVDELSHDRPSGLTAVQRLSVLAAGQSIVGDSEAVSVTLAQLRASATPATSEMVSRYLANMVASARR